VLGRDEDAIGVKYLVDRVENAVDSCYGMDAVKRITKGSST
jgi:hypothetical protein